jgi:hypothetical protein
MCGGVVTDRLELGVDLRQTGVRLHGEGFQFQVVGDPRQTRRLVGFPLLPVGGEHLQATRERSNGLGMGAQLLLGRSQLVDLFHKPTHLFIRLLKHDPIGSVAVT